MVPAISALLNWGSGTKEDDTKDNNEDNHRVVEKQVKQERSSENNEVLFLGDSHMKSLLVEELENKVGGNITHGVLPANSFTTSGGHRLRAYNSSFN